MRYILGLPTDHVESIEQFGTSQAIVEMATTAETLGFTGVFVTDHPAPPKSFLDTGGHHTLDPMITLAAAATSTKKIKLLTNLYIVAYRNPLLVAKMVASLDNLSLGRLILGVGAGYLKEEFQASMVIVHHTGHVSNGRARGSSVLPAALDYEFRVDRDKNSDDKAMLVTLKQTLVKDGTPIDDLYFQFKEQTLYGYEGVTSGVLAITDESPKKLGLTRAREETIKAIEDYQKEKEPNDPVSVWVKFTILKARMDISDSALKSRLADLKDMELVHYKEGYGYQAKSFDNEVF